MTWTQAFRLRALTVALSIAVATLAAAADKPPVPGSVVQTIDGAPVALDQFVASGRWLVVYLLPDSPTSRRLVAALPEWQLGAYDHVTIVLGGKKEDAVAFARAHESLGAQWLVDADQAFSKGLPVTGAPTLLGVADGTVNWRLAGVLNDPNTMKSVVASWLMPVAHP
jgi:hypothetical protein